MVSPEWRAQTLTVWLGRGHDLARRRLAPVAEPDYGVEEDREHDRDRPDHRLTRVPEGILDVRIPEEHVHGRVEQDDHADPHQNREAAQKLGNQGATEGEDEGGTAVD